MQVPDRRSVQCMTGATEPGAFHDVVVYVDHSNVDLRRIDELRNRIRRVVSFIDAEEPQLIAYGFHIDDVRGRMAVTAVHPDSASLELHLEVGRRGVPDTQRHGHVDRDRGLRLDQRARANDARAEGANARRRRRGRHRTVRRFRPPLLAPSPSVRIRPCSRNPVAQPGGAPVTGRASKVDR